MTHVPFPSILLGGRRSCSRLRLAAGMIAAVLGWSAACPAAVLTVTSASDSGAGTLRQALLSAAAGDTISFAANVSTITLTSAELLLSKNVTISGPGPKLLTVQTPANNFRIFDIASATVTASISGLTIANGGAYDSDNYGGGGIHNSGVLTLTNCALSNNYSGNGSHGGGDGGGIINVGVLTVTDSTFSGNRADWYGGGLYNYGMATLTNCTFSGNQGVGAAINNAGGSTTLTNCTISGNSAGQNSGGGIANNIAGGVTAKNCIIALNTSGVFIQGATPTGFDINGSLTSQGNNLIGKNTGASITPAQTSDQIGTSASPLNPLLGPLQDNGGKVFTCALLTGSPAIDAGDDSVLTSGPKLTTDERGTGFGRKVGAHVDIGAYEFGAGILPPVVTTVAAGGVTFDGATLKGTVNASNSSTTVSFDYGTSLSYGTHVTATPSPVTGGGANAVSYALTGLSPNTIYHYRVNGTASFVGTVNGKDLTFTTLDEPPNTVADSVAALPSAKVSIDVLANDTGAGGAALSIYSFTQPGAAVGTVAKVGSLLVFTPSAAFTGGHFTYVVADAFGGRSPATGVTLNPGTCSCASFLNAASDQGAETFAVTASAPFSVSGKPTWLGFNPILPGDTQVTFVFAPNASLNSRMATVLVGGNPVTVTQSGVTAVPVLTLPTLVPSAAISASYDLAIPTQNGPVTYTATHLPPGLTLSNTTGHITGMPTTANAYPVTVLAKNAKGPSNMIQFDLTVLPFPVSLVGGWSATVARDATVTAGLGGLLSFTVAANGPVTGTLKNGAASYAFTGRLNTAPNPSNPVPLNASLTVAIPKTSLVLVVNLNTPGTGYLSGTVSLGASSTTLSGAQQVWSLAGHALATDYSGAFTTALQPTTADASIPQGDGFLTFTVSTKGVVSWSGQLADGTVIATGSSALWPGGEVPLFAPLYTGKGSLLGAPVITAVTRVLTGSLSWSKSAQPTTVRAYGAGFGALNPVSLSLLGGGYIPPTGAAVLTGVTPPTGSAQITFADGGIASVNMAGALTQILTISTANVATLPSLFSGNSANIKITAINAASGTFAGNLTLKDPNPWDANLAPVVRPVNFSGVFLQGPQNNFGTGYFLLPAITGPPANVTTSAETSGQVMITPR